MSYHISSPAEFEAFKFNMTDGMDPTGSASRSIEKYRPKEYPVILSFRPLPPITNDGNYVVPNYFDSLNNMIVENG